jgi:hypothetical protein
VDDKFRHGQNAAQMGIYIVPAARDIRFLSCNTPQHNIKTLVKELLQNEYGKLKMFLMQQSL